MAHIEQIRTRVAEIADTWPDRPRDEVAPWVEELRGYTEEIGTDDHPDAGELSAQILQLIDNIENLNGS
ncbi:hypothetical protein [Nakamurella deserti]|uniref:hypothetical protein n=1 Tax=Nakamurella deserti TaxID=2164074 RepID=UPI000DBE386B|nr:hypothetical protein [Nakamurella deserti]